MTMLRAFLCLGLVVAAPAAAAPADGVIHATARDLAAAVANPTDGLATAPLPSGPGATALTVRRTRSGVIEVHTGLNDILVAQSGHAAILVGGTVSGNRETTPGEYRGGAIAGGRLQAMAPGDVIWIPAGVPHQLIVEPRGDFSYLAFKFAPPPSPPAR